LLMRGSRRFFLILVAILLALVTSLSLAARNKKSLPEEMTEHQRALQALNRLTFGARPGDVERVAAMGVDRWIDLQLHPEKIDNSALDARLAPLRTLRLDTHSLLENFPPPPVVKAVAEGRLPMPSDPDKRAIYEAQLERLREREQKREQDVPLNAASTTASQMPAQSEAGLPSAATIASRQQAHREELRLARQRADQLMELPPDQRYRELLRLSDEQRRPLAGLPLPERQQLIADMDPQQRETVLALENPQMVVASELQQGKLLRAIYSERQLEEVMADFWFNHFNVFIGKGADRYMLTSYERDVIRPHALGKFEDLLVATAKSPAMLFYLDNWMSIGPNSDFANYGPERRIPARQPRAGMGVGMGPWGPRIGTRLRVPVGGSSPANAPAKGKPKERPGLNENYARELMELHTLGVNGGYTQQDVTEVAKVFTGWTLKRPLLGGEFEFDGRKHEPETKAVLGHQIKSKGEDEGKQVLHMLAHHPSTAHFVSLKLAQRFVADDPPPALVDRMAKKFLDSDGNIREVLRTLFHAPEFWAPRAYRAKVKTPLEFIASAVRAVGADVQNAMPLVQELNRMGMQLYGSQPPTGYSMKAETWVNSAALLSRMNFALALAGGRIPGLSVDSRQLLAVHEPGQRPEPMNAAPSIPDPETVLARLESVLLAGDILKQTHETIQKRLQDPQVTRRMLDDPDRPPDLGVIAGLLLGSPEFQRR
jgi:uncharacterized protein (DUF1800 family)